MHCDDDPQKIVVLGDVHGDTRWTMQVLRDAREALAGEHIKVVVQLGDLGIGDWGQPGSGDAFLSDINQALSDAGMFMMVVPGNHEDYDVIGSWKEPGYPPDATFSPLTAAGKRLIRIQILPRGFRWQWHGRTWLACGGAASPDRAYRQIREELGNGKSWWPQEYITRDDVNASSTGPADVLVSHDRPAKAPISLPPWPRGWTQADFARCEQSRDMIQEICDATEVKHVLHGHYHREWQTCLAGFGYGPVQVTQFGMNGTDDNWRVLDIQTMTYSSS